MGTMLSIEFQPPAAILDALGGRAKTARLALGWTRKTLAARSGVAESTIKRFELTGHIGTAALVQIAMALDLLDSLSALFAPRAIQTIAQVTAPARQRGSR